MEMRCVCNNRMYVLKEEVLIYKHAPQVYVWIYDPVHFKTFAMGLILGELF